jgi:hypothetical protein
VLVGGKSNHCKKGEVHRLQARRKGRQAALAPPAAAAAHVDEAAQVGADGAEGVLLLAFIRVQSHLLQPLLDNGPAVSVHIVRQRYLHTCSAHNTLTSASGHAMQQHDVAPMFNLRPQLPAEEKAQLYCLA